MCGAYDRKPFQAKVDALSEMRNECKSTTEVWLCLLSYLDSPLRAPQHLKPMEEGILWILDNFTNDRIHIPNLDIQACINFFTLFNILSSFFEVESSTDTTNLDGTSLSTLTTPSPLDARWSTSRSMKYWGYLRCTSPIFGPWWIDIFIFPYFAFNHTPSTMSSCMLCKPRLATRPNIFSPSHLNF